jgi:hypothetical protein
LGGLQQDDVQRQLASEGRAVCALVRLRAAPAAAAALGTDGILRTFACVRPMLFAVSAAYRDNFKRAL